MKLFKYNQFRDSNRVNENLDKAKKILRDTYQTFKSVKAVAKDYDTDPSGLFLFNKEGDNLNFEDLPDDIKNNAKSKFRENALTPDEKTRVERSDILKEIRDILGDKLGYANLFTYFMVIEKVSAEELQELLSRLMEFRDLLGSKNPTDNKPLLRRPIDNYIDTNVPNNHENLVDDLENIALYKSVKKIFNEFTPVLKKDFNDSPPVIKKQVEELALAFSSLGMENGRINDEVQQKLWKLFFGEIKILQNEMTIRGKQYKAGDKIYSGQMYRYTNIREFIVSAQNYIKGANNTEKIKFYEQIESCITKFGDYGVKVMFDEADIVILEILSFQANQTMNSHTRHCIKDSLGQWNSYVGGEDKNTKQYYIYNFNLPPYDTTSVIGVTIGPGQRVTACHKKDDGEYSSQFKSTLKSWEKQYKIDSDLWQYFSAMSDSDIEKKRRRVLANREVVKSGLTIEELKKILTEDGADVNSGQGAPLYNAISESDVDKVKFLLEFGASPNVRPRQEAIINRVDDLKDPEKAFEIVKLLIKYGSELTRTAFKKMMYNVESVKFCLENGLDPNFDNGAAIRLAIRKGYEDVLDELLKAGGRLSTSDKQSLAFAFEGGSKKITDFVLKNSTPDIVTESILWMGHSPKLPKEERLKIIRYLCDKVESGEASLKKDGYVEITKDGTPTRKRISYDDIVKSHGSFYDYVILLNARNLK